jgi:ribosomal protein S4
MGIAPSRRGARQLVLTHVTVNGDVVNIALTTLNLVIKVAVREKKSLSNVLYLIQVMFMNGLLNDVKEGTFVSAQTSNSRKH